MGKIKIKKYTSLMKLADILMAPIMYVLSGFDKNWMQQTHAWHMQEIESNQLDKSKCVTGKTDSTAKFKGSKGFFKNWGLFHMPIIGGWSKYMVLKASKSDYNKYWRVGWIIHKDTNLTSEIDYIQAHRKPIFDNKLRVLKTSNQIAEFFAINDSSQQIPLEIVAEGKKGDNKYTGIPLY